MCICRIYKRASGVQCKSLLLYVYTLTFLGLNFMLHKLYDFLIFTYAAVESQAGYLKPCVSFVGWNLSGWLLICENHERLTL